MFAPIDSFSTPELRPDLVAHFDDLSSATDTASQRKAGLHPPSDRHHLNKTHQHTAELSIPDPRQNQTPIHLEPISQER